MSSLFAFFPGRLDPLLLNVLLILIGIFLLMAFLSVIIKKRQKGFYFALWRSLGTWAWSNMAIGAFLTFFAYEEVPVLSMRFLIVLWFAGILLWLLFILKRLKKIKEVRAQKAQMAEYKKYLP